MNKRVFLFVLIAAVLTISLVSASFTVDTNASNVKKTYSIGDYLSGTIAITFTNESADSLLTTSIGSSYTIKKWLELTGKQKNKDFNCSSQQCEISYRAVDSDQTVSISLTEPKNVGFALTGNNVTVKSISLKAQTSLPNSCSKQFSIGLFDTEKYILENYLSSGSLCGSPKRGCFDSTLDSGQYQLANLTTNEYCEKISLSPAPKYKVGATVSGPQGPLKENLKMRLYNDDFNIIYGTCNLPISGEQQECEIEYPIGTEANYNLCISSNNTNSAYQIKTEQRDQKCGVTSASKTSQSTIDFDIWAQPMEYASSQVSFDADKFALLNFEENWTKIANDYLNQKYSGNCINSECYLPLKVIGQSQTVSFSDAVLVYESEGVVKTNTQINEIEQDSGTITSGKIVLSLDQLKIPVSKKISSLEIKVGGKTAIKTTVDVKQSPIEINPGFALIGVPTKFKVESNLTIDSATWKFGTDLNTKQGTEVTYTFSNAGSYNVEVTAVATNGVTSTRTKSVVVGEPKASAEGLIEATENSIETIGAQITLLPNWIRTDIQQKIDPVQFNISLNEIKEKYLVAKTDSEYVSIISDIQTLNVPSALGTIKSGKFPIISGYASINVEYASALESAEFNEAQIKSALTEWLRENYNSEVEIETIGASFSTGTEAVLTRVKIVTNPLSQSQAQRYLIIDAPFESVHFMSGYSQKELNGGTYLPLEDGQQVIEFYVDGDVGIESLGAYILPSFSELEQGGYSYEVVGSNDDKRNKVIYISIIVILILLIISTFALQYWYRNNYEKHLFPKPEELYNIMTFIYNSQKTGLREGDIRKKLLTAGWTREQISYALGRIKGKILGLFGLPIYSDRQEKKVKEEIEIRQRRSK